jgi:myo-inositol-1(or 4)-monophosphatase
MSTTNGKITNEFLHGVILPGMVQAAKAAGALMMDNIEKRRTGFFAAQQQQGGSSSTGLSVETKSSPSDFVTQVDIACDELIMAHLKKTVAGQLDEEVGFLTEEAAPDAPVSPDVPFFCVDPIDGTTSFLHGLPCCCVSIAFCVRCVPVVGVVFVPMMNELYTAIKGSGAAFCNGAPLVRRGTGTGAPTHLRDALVCYHLPAQRSATRVDTSLKIVRELLMAGVHSVRCMGSAAVDMCNVAAGRADAYVELGINSWDVAAGICICAEAGCVALDLFDGPQQSLTTVRNGKMGLVVAGTLELAATVRELSVTNGLSPAEYLSK